MVDVYAMKVIRARTVTYWLTGVRYQAATDVAGVISSAIVNATLAGRVLSVIRYSLVLSGFKQF